MLKAIHLLDLGVVPYGQALALQYSLRQKLLSETHPNQRIGYLISLQHPITVTIGKRATTQALLNKQQLRKANTEIFKIDRGGEATLHNPGQLVIYPVLTLEDYNLVVVDLVRKTAYAAANAMKKYHIDATYDEDLPGLWVHMTDHLIQKHHYQGPSRRKLASVGMRISKGISTHGIAINVTNDLTPFSWIEACGLSNPPMAKISDFTPTVVFDAFKQDVLAEWGKLIGVELIKEELELPCKENWEKSNVEW